MTSLQVTTQGQGIDDPFPVQVSRKASGSGTKTTRPSLEQRETPDQGKICSALSSEPAQPPRTPSSRNSLGALQDPELPAAISRAAPNLLRGQQGLKLLLAGGKEGTPAPRRGGTGTRRWDTRSFL